MQHGPKDRQGQKCWGMAASLLATTWRLQGKKDTTNMSEPQTSLTAGSSLLKFVNNNTSENGPVDIFGTFTCTHIALAAAFGWVAMWPPSTITTNLPCKIRRQER
jgi:hypothetical protein